MTKPIVGGAGFTPFDNWSSLPVRSRRWTRSEIERDVRPLGVAVKAAMMLCMETPDHRFGRLLIPLRYRASGATEAWTAARRLSGRDGAKLAARLGLTIRLIRFWNCRHKLSRLSPFGEDEAQAELSEIYTRSQILFTDSAANIAIRIDTGRARATIRSLFLTSRWHRAPPSKESLPSRSRELGGEKVCRPYRRARCVAR